MSSRTVLAMVKRRVRNAELPVEISSHTFRATGITDYLASGGTIGHASTRTTQLYNRSLEPTKPWGKC